MDEILLSSSTNAIRANDIITNGGMYADPAKFRSMTSQEIDDKIDVIKRALSLDRDTLLLTAEDETTLIKTLWVLEETFRQGDPLSQSTAIQRSQETVQFLEKIQGSLFTTSRNMAEKFMELSNARVNKILSKNPTHWGPISDAGKVKISEFSSRCELVYITEIFIKSNVMLNLKCLELFFLPKIPI